MIDIFVWMVSCYKLALLDRKLDCAVYAEMLHSHGGYELNVRSIAAS
jgi:hypothetical protein